MQSKHNAFAALIGLACLALTACSGDSEGKVVVVKAGPPLEVGSISKTTTLFQVDTLAIVTGKQIGRAHV